MGRRERLPQAGGSYSDVDNAPPVSGTGTVLSVMGWRASFLAVGIALTPLCCQLP